MPLHTDYMYRTTTTLGCTQLCAKQRNDGNYCYRIRNAICDFTWETQIEEGQKRIPLVTTATTQYTLAIAEYSIVEVARDEAPAPAFLHCPV